jgi:hypothetical protein
MKAYHYLDAASISRVPSLALRMTFFILHPGSNDGMKHFEF